MTLFLSGRNIGKEIIHICGLKACVNGMALGGWQTIPYNHVTCHKGKTTQLTEMTLVPTSWSDTQGHLVNSFGRQGGGGGLNYRLLKRHFAPFQGSMM